MAFEDYVWRPYLKSSVLRFETFCAIHRARVTPYFKSCQQYFAKVFTLFGEGPSLSLTAIFFFTNFAALAEVAHELWLAVLVQVEAGARPRGLRRWRPRARCG